MCVESIRAIASGSPPVTTQKKVPTVHLGQAMEACIERMCGVASGLLPASLFEPLRCDWPSEAGVGGGCLDRTCAIASSGLLAVGTKGCIWDGPWKRASGLPAFEPLRYNRPTVHLLGGQAVLEVHTEELCADDDGGPGAAGGSGAAAAAAASLNPIIVSVVVVGFFSSLPHVVA